jgi:hypothetical protein
MKKFKFLVAGLAIAGFALYSCNKDDDNDNSFDDSDMLKAAAVIDKSYESDFQTAAETANDNAALSSRPSDLSVSSLTSCAVVTKTSTGLGFPMTFTVDFGTGCTVNGVTRKGMLTLTFSDFLLTSGSTLTIGRTNYFVDGYKIEGTVTYQNITTNGDIPTWTRTIASGQITTPDGEVYMHSGTRTVSQAAGVSTPFNLTDNVYQVVSGTATITRPSGTSLTATVTSPLVKDASCANISEGVLHIEGSVLNGDLDYGDGNCDNQAVYTNASGQHFTITLN